MDLKLDGHGRHLQANELKNSKRQAEVIESYRPRPISINFMDLKFGGYSRHLEANI